MGKKKKQRKGKKKKKKKKADSIFTPQTNTASANNI